MEMAASQPCPCSSFIFFTQQRKTHLRDLIHVPFCLFSPPHLSRRFSSYAAGDNSRSWKRRRRKWDSNAETIRAKGFSFNTQKDDNDEDEEDYDYDEELASPGILEEAIDSIWILKAFKSFGWTLPPILLSLLFATGPKAFLMALALPVGQSVITLAFKKLSGKSQSKQKRKVRVRRTKKYTSRRTVRNVTVDEEVLEGQKNQKGTKGYQSWVVNDRFNEGDQGATSFGGWDELDGIGSTMGMSSATESGSKTTVKANEKLSMKQSKSDEPLLLRLLIAVFPFLGSWTKLFW